MEHYRIRVSGQQPDDSLSALGEMTVSPAAVPLSLLHGDLPDQTLLSGVLECLEGVGVQVVEVVKVPS
jgi:hypothetical protein